MIPDQYNLKNTTKYPTSLIIGGLSKLGLEITDSLLEQGGYVIIVDTYTKANIDKLKIFSEDALISFIDYTSIPHLEEDLRRLDYIFYFENSNTNFEEEISTQQFLTYSNYVDLILKLSKKFDAKFLLATSVKAHQLNLAYTDNDILLQADDVARHKKYNNRDVQRYAESLTVEFIKDQNLDGRIIRIGEVIGDGIDFTENTSYNRMILQGARGENITLTKDGLESEWYVHSLDAAYGIIKALFSKNTTGNIYTLAYENPITHLAVAYKIQEAESVDIKFSEEKDNLPSFKLYKPAPNLSQIGWFPKVNLEKAVKQSLASAKIFLLENKEEIEGGTLSSKLKSFLSIANGEKESGIDKLISERKRKEQLKKVGIEYASAIHRERKRTNPKTFREKINYFVWSSLIDLGKKVTFFRNKTPVEFVGILLTFALILFVYISFISPAIVIGRNYLAVQTEMQSMETAASKLDFVALEQSSKNAKDFLNQSSNLISDKQWIINLVGANNQYQEIKTSLDNYSLMLDGVSNIAYSLSPLTQYLNQYKDNLQLRSATESYISTTNTGLDYSPILSTLNSRNPFLSNGLTKIQKASANISSTTYKYLPLFLSDKFVNINNKLVKSTEKLQYFDPLIDIANSIGVGSPKNYLVLLMDNTRFTSIGGDVAAFALVTFSNGGISEITVQSPDDANLNLGSINSATLKDLNLRRYYDLSKDSTNLNSLGSIYTSQIYSDYLKTIFEDSYKRESSGVLKLDYSSLDSIISGFNSQGITLNINGTKFDNSVPTGINSLQTGSPSLQTKHRFSAQLLANIFDIASKNSKTLLPSIISSLSNNYPVMQFNDKDLSTDSTLTSADSFVQVSINGLDSKSVNQDKYPSVSYALVVSVNPNYDLSYKLNVKFPNISSNQDISVCIPALVSNDSIAITGIEAVRNSIKTLDNTKCIVSTVISETEINYSWLMPLSKLGTDYTQKGLTLGINKVKGANSFVDYTIKPQNGISITDISNSTQSQNGGYAFTSSLDKDLIIRMDLSK